MNFTEQSAVEIPELTRLMENNDEMLNPCSREFYNSRTRRIQSDDGIVYFFQYDGSEEGEEVISWRELKHLRDNHRWNIIRHPMVLNFINEILLSQAYLYVAHIISYLIFLLLLSSYIFGKNNMQDFLSTLFLIIFGFFLVVKCAVKLQAGKISKWFILSYSFNVITYIATFLFVWTPLLFSYNDYNSDLKHFITWLLPIIAIISAWINFLYILRKSPYGIYILMLTRILYSFSQIAIIWIPTLLAFAFAFHLVMRNSGQEPWESAEVFSPNSTVSQKLLLILQAITKTSAMMIGEVDADNVLERKEWIPNLLLLTFEISTVILLMNLMISLAVGDVNELRQTAQEKLLDIKVNFAIESLQLSETCDCLSTFINMLHRKQTNNILVIHNDGTSFTTWMNVKIDDADNFDITKQNITKTGQHMKKNLSHCESNRIPLENITVNCENGKINNNNSENEQQLNERNTQELLHNIYHLQFPSGNRRMRILKKGLVGRMIEITLDGAIIELIESIESGIKSFQGTINGQSYTGIDENPESYGRKFARWLIGLDWSNLLQL
uniref:Ion transport domain-containing protein n=2 Tax=Wuchereria bancrofti TaxID=6293 RepID=A0AAF5RX60_WUCBA